MMMLAAILATFPASSQEAQIVALAVRTEPAGATVRVNRLAKTWTTPCDIADFSLRRGQIELEIMLPGHETVRRSVLYDGEVPVHLELKLKPVQAVAPPPPPAPVPPKQIPAAVPRGPGTEDGAPPPAPPKAAAAPGADVPRFRIASGSLAVRVTAGKASLADGAGPAELLLPQGLSEKVLVEFLDPKTGAVLATVEALPGTAPSSIPVPAPPAVESGDRVGQVQLVHRMYGVFVKLDPGLHLAPGEEILILRDGREVARTQIERIIRQDETYPDGAVLIPKSDAVRKGDEVRRNTKP